MKARVAVSLALVLAVSGCAPAAIAPSSSPTATPTPTPSATVRAVPTPSFDLSCSDLVPPAALAELYESAPSELSLGVPDFKGDNAYRIAARQDGALICEWSWPDAGPYQQTVMITAVRGLTSGFTQSRAVFEEQGFPGYLDNFLYYRSLDDEQGSFVAGCYSRWSTSPTNGATCKWSANAGDVWIEATFVDLPASEVGGVSPPDESTSIIPVEPDFTTSLSAQIVRSALETLAAAAVVDQPQPASPRSCDEVLPPTDAALEALGVTLSGGPLETSITDPNWWFEFGQAQWKSSASRQGWTRCLGELGDLGRLELLSAPGAAWIVDAGAPFGPVNAVDYGFEECGGSEAGEVCTLAAVAGTDVLVIELENVPDAVSVGRTVLAAMVAAHG